MTTRDGLILLAAAFVVVWYHSLLPPDGTILFDITDPYTDPTNPEP